MSIPFRIRFINATQDQTKDDVLTINKIDDNTFQWTFKDSSDSKNHSLTLSHGYNVTDRVQTLLEMFAADSSPAAEMQVDVPGFPTVLFKASQVYQNISLVRESLNHVLIAWPEREATINCSHWAQESPEYWPEARQDAERAARRERRWKREGGRLRTNSTYDDDLPPLIPVSSYETPRRGTHLYFD